MVTCRNDPVQDARFFNPSRHIAGIKGAIDMSNESPKPNPDLKSLNHLVGSWNVSGDATGTIKYEWTEGGFFLVQHFDFVHDGRSIKGIELIGHLHPFEGEPSEDIHTRVYSFTDGMTLDYVYEVTDGTLMIWGGEKGSPMFYRGTFSGDKNTVTGGWQWPGGGYTANMARSG
jgi:hypothetical protein